MDYDKNHCSTTRLHDYLEEKANKSDIMKETVGGRSFKSVFCIEKNISMTSLRSIS